LESYEEPLGKNFWENFKFNDLPKGALSDLNVKELDNLIEKQKNFMTYFELKRAIQSSENLKKGASSHQKTYLPPCHCKNAKNTYIYAEPITDTVGHWLKRKLIAGPFDCPPLSDLRINSLVAIDQGDKIRPVLNVSIPENCSFNDNIEKLKLEKCEMSNARRFGFSVCDAGVNCNMSKFDLVDAYKLVPVHPSELRLQGFMWLGKIFIECKQIFGAISAVSNFDIFSNTILTLAIADTEFPKSFFHRTLDDVPFVAPAHKDWCSVFSEKYKNVCEKLGVETAKECPKKEKAFENSKTGKVLGINFDTKILSWNFPRDKKEKILRLIKKVLNSEKIELLEM